MATVASAPAPAGSAMLRRVVSTVVLVPIFAWLVVGAPAWMFHLLVVAASGAAMWELARMFDQAQRPVYKWLGVALAIAVTASFASATAGAIAAYPALAMALAIGIVVSAPVWGGAVASTEAPANTLLGITYIGWLLGFAILLHALPQGPALILFLMGVTWAGETAAYLVGSLIGRRRLAPTLSPGKTVEGAVAQVVVSILAAVLLTRWLLPGCGGMFALAAGGLIGLVGQIGDLAESAIKRSVGTKDTSQIIPGHGGVLDRIDSLLFNIPMFYGYIAVMGCGR
jgi:phosphatidate cytidylyltransferase